jgi:hypothetical protein
VCITELSLSCPFQPFLSCTLPHSLPHSRDHITTPNHRFATITTEIQGLWTLQCSVTTSITVALLCSNLHIAPLLLQQHGALSRPLELEPPPWLSFPTLGKGKQISSLSDITGPNYKEPIWPLQLAAATHIPWAYKSGHINNMNILPKHPFVPPSHYNSGDMARPSWQKQLT